MRLLPYLESWSVLLQETLVVLAGRFYYVKPLVAYAIWDFVASAMGSWSPLLIGIMIASTTWKFGHRSGLPKRVVFATLDLNRFRYGPLVVSVIRL